MKVKFLASIAAEDFAYRPGEVAYLQRELAQKFIHSGVCVFVGDLPTDPAPAPEQPILSSTTKPNSLQLREKLEQAQAAIQTKQAERSKLLESVEESSIGAILAGKRSQAPALLSKARELQTQIEELQSGLQPLERALALVENEETEAARQAEERRLADLRSKYRAAVGALINSIETAGHDLAACIRIQEAEAALAVIAFQFPERKRPASVVIENPSMISCDEQGSTQPVRALL